MSKYQFKRIVKQKTAETAFQYLLSEKNKQSKISHIKYKRLEIQEYLCEGNKNIETSKVIFKARGKTLDIKSQKKWKYEDNICVGCGKTEESIEEILSCSGLGVNNDEKGKPVEYDWVFGQSVTGMIEVGQKIKKRLKVTQQILDLKT